MNQSHTSDDASQVSGQPRRGFLMRFMTGLLASILGLVPSVFGFLFFFDPLLRSRKGGAAAGQNPKKDADGFIKMDVTRDSLPDDGTPMSFKVYDDKVDAWNKFLQVEIGQVWLRKTPDGEIVAFSTICPHLGCAVDYRAGRGDFFCPCHTSAFDMDGQRTNEIPPRGMDALVTKLKPETGETIWLQYQKFRAGTEEMIPIK